MEALIAVAGLLWFGGTSLIAVWAMWLAPRLWPWSLAVVGIAAAIVLYLPIRLALYVPSSFDSPADGIMIFGEFIGLLLCGGFFHFGCFLVVLGTLFNEYRHRMKEPSPSPLRAGED
jgi:hypothetical protein